MTPEKALNYDARKGIKLHTHVGRRKGVKLHLFDASETKLEEEGNGVTPPIQICGSYVPRMVY